MQPANRGLKGYMWDNFATDVAVVVYPDTWVLRGIVSKKHRERREAARLLARLRSGVYVVKVSQVIIGEAVATVMRDFDPDEWEEVVGRIMQAIASVADPATCLPPLDTAVAKSARRLKTSIKRMTDTDALFAAQALHDPESQKVLTRDTLLTSSGELKKVAREMKENGERVWNLEFDDKV